MNVSLKEMELTKIQEGPISDIEKLVMSRIEDQTQKFIPHSTLTIRDKTKSLFAMLNKKAEPDYDVEFIASSGEFK